MSITRRDLLPQACLLASPRTDWERRFFGVVKNVRNAPWRIGDLLNHQDAPHGTKYDFVEKCGVNRKTAQQWAWVASKYQPSMRIEMLSFNHHQIVASLPQPERQSLLRRAVSQRLTTHELRELVRQKQREETKEANPLPNGRYRVLYADPPWQDKNQGTRAATDTHYPTMPIEDICTLPVEGIAAEQSLLFLWATSSFLVEALTQVIPAWGFTYKSAIVWVKPQMGLGNYVRVAHEYLLIANRGGLVTQSTSQKSWVKADRQRHSKKPEVFRGIVENLCDGPRIELFARTRTDGWDAWGDEVDTPQHETRHHQPATNKR